MIFINIIIGSKDDVRLFDISRRLNNSLVVHNYCKLKNLKTICTLIIPFEKILPNGFINNTEISLDELLLQLGVIKIIYGNINNGEALKRFSRDYHVKVEYFKF